MRAFAVARPLRFAPSPLITMSSTPWSRRVTFSASVTAVRGEIGHALLLLEALAPLNRCSQARAGNIRRNPARGPGWFRESGALRAPRDLRRAVGRATDCSIAPKIDLPAVSNLDAHGVTSA